MNANTTPDERFCQRSLVNMWANQSETRQNDEITAEYILDCLLS